MDEAYIIIKMSEVPAPKFRGLRKFENITDHFWANSSQTAAERLASSIAKKSLGWLALAKM